jgi:hypothetical protein
MSRSGVACAAQQVDGVLGGADLVGGVGRAQPLVELVPLGLGETFLTDPQDPTELGTPGRACGHGGRGSAAAGGGGPLIQRGQRQANHGSPHVPVRATGRR